MSVKTTIFRLMCEEFKKVEKIRSSFDQCITILLKAYKKYDFEHFLNAYKDCRTLYLLYIQDQESIDNGLEFAALLAVKLTPEDDDELSPFLKGVFHYILTKHGEKLSYVCLRTCHFLNLLLHSMAYDANLDCELHNNIIKAMQINMKDESLKVRVQAVSALHRMQNPSDDKCEVIEIYIHYLTHEPCVDVRKAIIMSIAKNKKTLYAVYEKIYDIDYSVRKNAYLFLSKITPKSFKIKQRRKILNCSLQGQNYDVLKTWLMFYNNEITEFLYALDIEIAPDIGIIVLNNIFQMIQINDLIKQLPIDKNKKLIPIHKLTSENVLLCLCLAKYSQKSKFDNLFEQLLPELSYFCDHIRKYGEIITNNNNNKSIEDCKKITEQAILCQLFEMTELYDLSDEQRNNLKQHKEDTLSIELLDQEFTKLVGLNETVVPDISSKVINQDEPEDPNDDDEL